MGGRLRRRRPVFHPSWPEARARRSWRARPWRCRRVIVPASMRSARCCSNVWVPSCLRPSAMSLRRSPMRLASLRHSRTAGVAISSSTAGTRPFSSFSGRSCCDMIARSASRQPHPADLALLARQGREDPLDGGDHVGRGHRRDHEPAGLRALDRRIDGVGVADLAQHDDVRILPQRGPEHRSSGCRCRPRPRAG